jgi:hypothetical protein
MDKVQKKEIGDVRPSSKILKEELVYFMLL